LPALCGVEDRRSEKNEEGKMQLFKKHDLTFEGKDYEIRVYYDERIINVVAFFNHYPANGFRHQIKIPKQNKIEDFLDKKPVLELVEMAKSDITENRWPRFLQSGIS
jgi:hypothetical protein